MRIGELCKRTGLSKQTIHYYIREGLLRRPRKRGKNAAEYNEGYVEQIQLIRTLQENYFLPLSIIKVILKRIRRLSLPERSSFLFLSEYLRPLELLLTSEVEGREEFKRITGLKEKYLTMFEDWQVITPESRDGKLIYCQEDVIIGKIMVTIDRLGFGPKDGTDPEDLKRITDFVRDYVVNSQKSYYEPRLAQLSQRELEEKGSKATEAMSLFFYHIYRKLFRQHYSMMLKRLDAKSESAIKT